MNKPRCSVRWPHEGVKGINCACYKDIVQCEDCKLVFDGIGDMVCPECEGLLDNEFNK